MLVQLGTELGSKAYRLLEPKTQKIVVSRDVVFDETQGWNWNQATHNKIIMEFCSDFRKIWKPRHTRRY